MEPIDIIFRTQPPTPWSESEKIPWDEPDFSRRMLREHLTQKHSLASRKFEIIDKHVNWIYKTASLSQESKVLDLGCGPGLYSSRLARLGCTCVGIDFSPASIEYALEEARQEGLSITYIHEDIRTAKFGQNYDLILFVFGEFNVFKKEHASRILSQCRQSLKPGGKLILEVNPFDTFQKTARTSTWFTGENGLFSDRPYLCLIETYWDEPSKTSTSRHYVIQNHSTDISTFSSTTQAYTREEYTQLLSIAGFSNITFHPSLTGVEDDAQEGLFVILTEKTR